jgi:hypothetical protein
MVAHILPEPPSRTIASFAPSGESAALTKWFFGLGPELSLGSETMRSLDQRHRQRHSNRS